MGNITFALGFYFWSVVGAMRPAALAECLTVLGTWLLMPLVLVEGLAHPADGVALWCWMSGEAFPSTTLSGPLAVVASTAVVIALAGVVAVHEVARERLYRKAGYEVALWPLALLVAVAGNGGWWWGTGVFDPAGTFAGFVPAIVAAAFDRLR